MSILPIVITIFGRAAPPPRHRARAVVAAAALGLSLALGLPAAPTQANGSPINVTLTYLPGVSNWGPTNATGVAELVFREGEVRLTATGLPALQDERYRLWLINTVTGEELPLASFNSDEDGVARLDRVLEDAIPDRDWNLLLVAVEPDGNPARASGDRRAIAGRIVPPTAGQERPGELPRTGGAPAPGGPLAAPGRQSTLPSGLVAAVALLPVALIAGFGLGRWTTRRQGK